MIREEAKKEFWEEGGVFEEMFEYCFNKVLKLPYKGRVIDVFIDKIYDDFESRICKNCKHFKSKSGLCGLWENGKMNEASFFNVDEDFGCNRFERREDERD